MEEREEDKTICMNGKFVNVKDNSLMTLIVAVKVRRVLWKPLNIFSLQIQLSNYLNLLRGVGGGGWWVVGGG